jgi:hypothetical protein
MAPIVYQTDLIEAKSLPKVLFFAPTEEIRVGPDRPISDIIRAKS